MMVALVAMLGVAMSPVPAMAEADVYVIAGTGGNTTGLVNEVPARSAALWNPWDIDTMPDGGVIFADTDHHQVRRITPDGIVHRFAGGDTWGCNKYGTLLWQPRGVLSDNAGGAYISNTQCAQIIHVDADGRTEVVAGYFDEYATGYAPPFSDGMPALQARISQPIGLTFDSSTGSLYIAAEGDNMVYRVATEKIWRVAGTGPHGYNGDGMAATDAQLNRPRDLTFRAGELFIADTNNTRVRMVDESGVIHTVAGNGSFIEDEGSGAPTQLGIGTVSSVDFSDAGALYIASQQSGNVRTIDQANIIHTVGHIGRCAGGIALGSDDSVYLADPCAQYLYRATQGTPPPPIPDCPPLQFVGVRGSGETANDADGYGTTVADVKDRLAGMVPGMASTAIDYPAVPMPIDKFDSQYIDEYRESVTAGTHQLLLTMETFLRACSSTPVAVVGYSQGAHVVGDTLDLLTDQEKQLVHIVLIGDPRFNPGQVVVDVGSYKDHPGIYSLIDSNLRVISPVWESHVRSYCAKGDPICNFTVTNARKCAQTKKTCSHLQYAELTYTEMASTWIRSNIG